MKRKTVICSMCGKSWKTHNIRLPKHYTYNFSSHMAFLDGTWKQLCEFGKPLIDVETITDEMKEELIKQGYTLSDKI